MSDVSDDISEWKTEEDFQIDVHNFLEINLIEKQEEIDIIEETEETVRFSLFIHFFPRVISSIQFYFIFLFFFKMRFF